MKELKDKLMKEMMSAESKPSKHSSSKDMKLAMLKELRQAMDKIMMEGESPKLPNEIPSDEMEKVSVMANNKEDLQKGLEKAKELLDMMPEDEDDEDEEDEE